MISSVFQPGTIGQVKLQNRIVRASTWERLAKGNGIVSSSLLDIYEELAKGGVGLILTSYAYVMEKGKAAAGQIGIFSDDHIQGLRQLTDRVHKIEDSKIFIQLVQGLNFQESTEPNLKEEEITEVIANFGDAGRRASEAGFDGIEIHAAHNYLFSTFLSPHTNNRMDKYGGSSENRSRIVTETINAIKIEVGSNFPIIVKINIMEGLDNGMNPQIAGETIGNWLGEGLDGIETSGGLRDSPREFRSIQPVGKKEQPYFLKGAEYLKEMYPDLTVILVGGVRSLGKMEKIIEKRSADFISLSRPLIREPDLPMKMKNGITTNAACISCSKCLKNIEEGFGCWQTDPPRIRKEFED